MLSSLPGCFASHPSVIAVISPKKNMHQGKRCGSGGTRRPFSHLCFYFRWTWAIWALRLLWLVKSDWLFSHQGADTCSSWKLWSGFFFRWTVAPDVEAVHVLCNVTVSTCVAFTQASSQLFLFYEPGMRLHVSTWCQQPFSLGICIIHYFYMCSNHDGLSNPCTLKRSLLRPQLLPKQSPCSTLHCNMSRNVNTAIVFYQHSLVVCHCVLLCWEPAPWLLIVVAPSYQRAHLNSCRWKIPLSGFCSALELGTFDEMQLHIFMFVRWKE